MVSFVGEMEKRRFLLHFTIHVKMFTAWVSFVIAVVGRLLILVCFFHSDQIAVRQSQVDKLYAGLKDLSNERKSKLEEVLKLYVLNREIDDIMQWIAEKEIVAGSHELGADFEHVCVSICSVHFLWFHLVLLFWYYHQLKNWVIICNFTTDVFCRCYKTGSESLLVRPRALEQSEWLLLMTTVMPL